MPDDFDASDDHGGWEDEVSLHATGTGGKLTATAIQDPASLP
jgi:hypothetical protein